MHAMCALGKGSLKAIAVTPAPAAFSTIHQRWMSACSCCQERIVQGGGAVGGRVSLDL